MKKIVFTAFAAAAVVAVAMWALDVDVTGDLEFPKVVADVDVKGGEMPRVDVETVSIDVNKKNAQVPYPTDVDVDVKTEKASVPYPSVEVTSPEENRYAEEDDL